MEETQTIIELEKSTNKTKQGRGNHYRNATRNLEEQSVVVSDRQPWSRSGSKQAGWSKETEALRGLTNQRFILTVLHVENCSERLLGVVSRVEVVTKQNKQLQKRNNYHKTIVLWIKGHAFSIFISA